MIMLICSYLCHLRRRLTIVNHSLILFGQEISEEKQQESFEYSQSKLMTEKWKEVYKTRKVSNKLFRLIRIFNKLFGWEIALTIIYVIMDFLSLMNFVIISFLSEGKEYTTQSVFKQETIWYIILWSTASMVSVTLLFIYVHCVPVIINRWSFHLPFQFLVQNVLVTKSEICWAFVFFLCKQKLLFFSWHYNEKGYLGLI